MATIVPAPGTSTVTTHPNVISVLTGIVSSLTVDPATKASWNALLNDVPTAVETTAAAAPAVTGQLAGDLVGEVESFEPAPLAAVGNALGINQELEAFANVLVNGFASKLETTLENHNQKTITAVTSAIASAQKATS